VSDPGAGREPSGDLFSDVTRCTPAPIVICLLSGGDAMRYLAVVALLSACLALIGCSMGPAPPQPGTPAFSWAEADGASLPTGAEQVQL